MICQEITQMVGRRVRIINSYTAYSAKLPGGRWLELKKPIVDIHSVQPGEVGVITEVREGRWGFQFHIRSIKDPGREDWYSSNDFIFDDNERKKGT